DSLVNGGEVFPARGLMQDGNAAPAGQLDSRPRPRRLGPDGQRDRGQLPPGGGDERSPPPRDDALDPRQGPDGNLDRRPPPPPRDPQGDVLPTDGGRERPPREGSPPHRKVDALMFPT